MSVRDIHSTKFGCGCIWLWWTGEPGPQNHRWAKVCKSHTNQHRPKGCTCLNKGLDDGATTCWKHHDCSDGSCTHQDGED